MYVNIFKQVYYLDHFGQLSLVVVLPRENSARLTTETVGRQVKFILTRQPLQVIVGSQLGRA